MVSNGSIDRISIGNNPGTSEMNGLSSSSIRAILVLDNMVVGPVAKRDAKEFYHVSRLCLYFPPPPDPRALSHR